MIPGEWLKCKIEDMIFIAAFIEYACYMLVEYREKGQSA